MSDRLSEHPAVRDAWSYSYGSATPWTRQRELAATTV